MPTIRQIAAICRVSPMTVSYVLNDKQGQVSEETRQRVLKAVRESGYRPRPATRTRLSSAVSTVGISIGSSLSSFVQPGYAQSIISGVFSAVDRHGLNVMIFHRSFGQQETASGIQLYRDRQCDGIVFVAPLEDSPVVTTLAERGTPVVSIGTQIGNLPSVDVNNRLEAEQTVGYLVNLGHRRIAFMGGPDFVQSARLRAQGYRRGLAKAGLSYDPALEFGNVRAEVMVYQLVSVLMQRPPAERPTALICWNDMAAVRALMALGDLEIPVPDAVSVVGFDDGPIAETAVPRLTTYRQPYFEIGEQAVEMLLEVVSGRQLEQTQVFLPAERIVRQSVGPAPS